MSSPRLSAYDVRATIAAMAEAERLLRDAALCGATANPNDCSRARGALAYWRENLMARATVPIELEPAP